MNGILLIARHEIKLIAREPRFLILFMIMPLFLGISQIALLLMHSIGNLEIATTLRLIGLLVSSSCLTLSADSFAGERERRSLETLLCLPLSSRQIFFGKILGILPLPLLSAWLIQGTILCLAKSELADVYYYQLLLEAVLLTPIFAFFIVTVSTWISAISKTVRTATQASSFILILALGLCLSVLSLPSMNKRNLFLLLSALTIGGITSVWRGSRAFDKPWGKTGR